MRVVTIVGARPQFIKSLPVSAALARVGIGEYLLHTGQHYEHNMSQIFFEQLAMRAPDHNLHVGSGSHARQTAAMLVGIEEVLEEQRPDALVLYGDTNSTLAGALAACKMGIPIAHVEAGLRSFDRGMPEEINRELTDKVSTWLFVPTAAAQGNLVREGASLARVHLVGDVMYDIFLQFAELAPPLRGLPSDFVLVTIHRPDNTDVPERLQAITGCLKETARVVPLVFPVHPRTRKLLSEASGGGLEDTPGLTLLEPQGYLEMLALLRSCQLVLTDSGGLQKEAFFARKPCVVLRDSTEWSELLEADWNLLLPPGSPEMTARICARLGHQGREVELYGGGQASTRIAEILAKG